MILALSSWSEINAQEALDQISEFIKASEIDLGIWRALTGNCWQSCKALEGNGWSAGWSIDFWDVLVIKNRKGRERINPAVGKIQHSICTGFCCLCTSVRCDPVRHFLPWKQQNSLVFYVFLKPCKNLPKCGGIWRDLMNDHTPHSSVSEWISSSIKSACLAFALPWTLINFRFFILYLFFSLS